VNEHRVRRNIAPVALFHDICQAPLAQRINPQDFPSGMATVRSANNGGFYKDVVEFISIAESKENDSLKPDRQRVFSRGAIARLRNIPDFPGGPYAVDWI
jgi:hypothetical protein